MLECLTSGLSDYVITNIISICRYGSMIRPSRDNKIEYVDKDNQPHKGFLLAMSPDQNQAVVIALNDLYEDSPERKNVIESIRDSVRDSSQAWDQVADNIIFKGYIYLVTKPEAGPPVLESCVCSIPEGFRLWSNGVRVE